MTEKESELVVVDKLAKMSYRAFVNYTVFQVIRNMPDLIKFATAVEALEALLQEDIEKDSNYLKDLQTFIQELNQKYGTNPVDENDKINKIRELTLWKFRRLVKILRSKIPEEVIVEM